MNISVWNAISLAAMAMSVVVFFIVGYTQFSHGHDLNRSEHSHLVDRIDHLEEHLHKIEGGLE